MEAAPPPPRRRPLEREPLSLGEIRDIWPLLAHADRIQAFLLLPRDEAEDFFFGAARRATRPTSCWACRRASSGRGCAACRPTTPPT